MNNNVITLNNFAVNNSTTTGVYWPELTSRTDFGAKLTPIYDLERVSPSSFKYEAVEDPLGRFVKRTDNGINLGIVGATYGVAENAPLYDMIKEGAEKALPREALRDVKLREQSSHNGAFTKIELTFSGIGADIRQLSGSKTQLLFKAGFTNSFNGSGAIRLYSGAIDLVCTNGCTSAEYQKKAARHTSGFTPDIFAGFIEKQCEDFLLRVDTWRAWAQKAITPDQAEKALEDAGMAGRKIKLMMEQFEQESMARGRSVWALYSALTAYSSHADLFPVRNSSVSDNIAVTLDNREREVSRIVSSDEWRQLAVA